MVYLGKKSHWFVKLSLLPMITVGIPLLLIHYRQLTETSCLLTVHMPVPYIGLITSKQLSDR